MGPHASSAEADSDARSIPACHRPSEAVSATVPPVSHLKDGDVVASNGDARHNHRLPLAWTVAGILAPAASDGCRSATDTLSVQSWPRRWRIFARSATALAMLLWSVASFSFFVGLGPPRNATAFLVSGVTASLGLVLLLAVGVSGWKLTRRLAPHGAVDPNRRAAIRHSTKWALLGYIPMIAGFAWMIFATQHWSGLRGTSVGASGLLIGLALGAASGLPDARGHQTQPPNLGLVTRALLHRLSHICRNICGPTAHNRVHQRALMRAGVVVLTCWRRHTIWIRAIRNPDAGSKSRLAAGGTMQPDSSVTTGGGCLSSLSPGRAELPQPAEGGWRPSGPGPRRKTLRPDLARALPRPAR